MKSLLLENLSGRIFHSISSKLTKRLEKDGKKFGLTTSNQFGILLILSETPMSQKEIANKSFSDEPTTTRTLDRMIKNGLVIKNRSVEDKRKQVVQLTEKGNELLEKIFPIVLEINREIRELFNEKEFEQFMKMMHKIDLNFEV